MCADGGRVSPSWPGTATPAAWPGSALPGRRRRLGSRWRGTRHWGSRSGSGCPSGCAGRLGSEPTLATRRGTSSWSLPSRCLRSLWVTLTSNSIQLLTSSILEWCNENLRFLDVFPGPGVQHIGLCTDDIERTVSILSHTGVDFRTPPPAYYSLVSFISLEIHLIIF